MADEGKDIQDLARRARAGDGTAFESIVNLYSRRIVAYCHRMAGSAAEDLAQEVFVKLYLALPSFDTSRPLAPFLFRIAHNHCLDALRRQRPRTVPLAREGEEDRHAASGPSPEDLAEGADIGAAVAEALDSLPPPYRSVLTMRHVDGLRYEEIAQALDLPMGTVKARIHRGREMMQQKLAGHVTR